jgi:hypothetical protein
MSYESQSTSKDLNQEATESFIQRHGIADIDRKVSQELQDSFFQVFELSVVVSLRSKTLFEIFSVYQCFLSCLKSITGQDSVYRAFEISARCAKKLMSYRLIEICEKKDVDIQYMHDYTLLLQPVNAPHIELHFTYQNMILILPIEDKPSCLLTYTVDTLKNSQYPKKMVEFLIECLYNGTELGVFHPT